MTPAYPLSRPFFDGHEVDAVRRILESGWLVQGPEVLAFEKQIAVLQGARHCIAVSSGTAALHIAYLSLGIGPGDLVFIPSFAWPSAANMARLVGATPMFVDVIPGTYNMDPAHLERAIDHSLSEGLGRPRVVVPVHEFGLPAEMDAILRIAGRNHLLVVEDAACALGASTLGKPVGTHGEMGIFSFHPRKSITTGEGGAIVTQDDALAERCREWRNHGQRPVGGSREFVVPGPNYRLTEIQAALGRVQLAKLDMILERRRQGARTYAEELAGTSLLTPPECHDEHTWQTYMVVLPPEIERQRVIQRLKSEGIEVGPGSVAGHLGKTFHPQPGLPVSELLHRQGLALPLHAGMDSAAIRHCAQRLIAALEIQG
jgi:perosamine synthetase